MRELGVVIDQLWPNYERAALEAGISSTLLHTELVLGGWSPQSRRFEATAYAKSESGVPAVVQRLAGGLASAIGQVCRKIGFAKAALYVWRKKYGRLAHSELKWPHNRASARDGNAPFLRSEQDVEQGGQVSDELLMGHPALQVMRPHITNVLCRGLLDMQGGRATVGSTAKEHFARSVYDRVGELDSALASLRLVSAFLQAEAVASDPDPEKYRYHYENFVIRGIGVVDRAFLLVADSLMLPKRPQRSLKVIESKARSHPLVHTALCQVKKLLQPYRSLRNRVAHESAYRNRDLTTLGALRQLNLDVGNIDLPAAARGSFEPQAAEVAKVIKRLRPALENLLASLAPIYSNAMENSPANPQGAV